LGRRDLAEPKRLSYVSGLSTERHIGNYAQISIIEIRSLSVHASGEDH